LAKQGEGLVLHFLFWAKNQAQEQVYALVEDVPPSRLKRLESIWQRSLDSFSPFSSENTEARTLDSAIRSTVQTFLGLAGKNEQDQELQRAKVFEVIGKLLGKEQINVKAIKMMMVSRFPGLFADAEWLMKKGRFETGRMHSIVDFIEKANRR
jgi:CRISPR-associated protein Csh1